LAVAGAICRLLLERFEHPYLVARIARVVLLVA
jgi:hypothetical protein